MSFKILSIYQLQACLPFRKILAGSQSDRRFQLGFDHQSCGAWNQSPKIDKDERVFNELSAQIWVWGKLCARTFPHNMGSPRTFHRSLQKMNCQQMALLVKQRPGKILQKLETEIRKLARKVSLPGVVECR